MRYSLSLILLLGGCYPPPSCDVPAAPNGEPLIASATDGTCTDLDPAWPIYCGALIDAACGEVRWDCQSVKMTDGTTLRSMRLEGPMRLDEDGVWRGTLTGTGLVESSDASCTSTFDVEIP